MNQLQRLKMALIAYVNSAKAVWSAIAHPLTIVSKFKRNVKDYKIHGNTVYGKNLLDVNKYYGEWANENGGISIPYSGVLYKISDFFISVKGIFKENTQYTFSCNYNIAETTTTIISAQMKYTDGTRSYINFGFNHRMGEGTASFVSKAGKTVESFSFTYGTTSKVFNGELTEIQIEEGTAATEYEPCNPQYTGDVITEGDNIGKYHLPVEVRGKNYFDINKIPFSNSATKPYNNGLKATKIAAANRGDKIPVSLPVGKKIYMTMDVVDSQMGGTVTRVTMGFYNSSKTLVRSTYVTATAAHKSYSFTLSEEVSYIQFYFQADNGRNSVGDYVTIDNIMLRTEGDDTYEPYIEPQTADVYLDTPLGADEVIQQSVDGLPELSQFKGTTIYEVQTEVAPSGMEVCYYE